jgi:ureidoacrylate peracid hydrolase
MTETTLDIKETALIVVDMQNDFCDMRGYYGLLNQPLSDLRKIIPNIQTLLETFRRSGGTVVFTMAIYEPDGADLPHKKHRILPGFAQRGNALLVARNSWGSEIIEELKPEPEEYVIRKHRFSAFHNTDLEFLLRSREIKTVVITGIVTYICVEHLARDAFIRDFDVIVVSDAVGGRDRELHENSLKSMAWSCGLVSTTEEVLRKVQFCVGAAR